jgi:hypothetical protein
MKPRKAVPIIAVPNLPYCDSKVEFATMAQFGAGINDHMDKDNQIKAFLSKSTFIRGMQCEKSLYLHKKRPFLRDRLSAAQLAKFTRGHEVGVYARQLFPGGEDLGAASPFQMAASERKTAAAIQSGQKVIYEATFQYRGVRVALDILHRTEQGWEAVEVKSSRSVSETYLWDASLQYFVIAGSGLDLKDFSIAYINPAYIRSGDVDIRELFIIEGVMGRIIENQEIVREKVDRFREVVNLPKSPEIAVGSHCTNPYPCDFIGHCWKKQIRESPLSGDGHKQLPDRGILEAFMKKAEYADLCFSSLSFAPAIPLFEGTSPYQQLGFSLGWLPISDGAPEILQGEPGALFPASRMQDFLTHLESAPGLLVYDKPRELEVLGNLCAGDAGLNNRLDVLAGRMHDLKELFSTWLLTPWDQSLHDSPEDALAILGEAGKHSPEFPAGRLDAARLMAELSAETAPSDKKEKLELLRVFHSDCLKNLRKLTLSLKRSLC